METKDYITLAGITATVILSSWSLVVTRRNSKKTLFINSVTASRIRFMDDFRNNIAEFCGIALHIAFTEIDEPQERPLIEKLDKLRFLIKLQLNRDDTFDRSIIDIVDRISWLLDDETITGVKQRQFEKEIDKKLNELVMLSQDFLKLEWEGVKAESTQGELSKDKKSNLYRQHLLERG